MRAWQASGRGHAYPWRMSPVWWLRNRRYLLFIVREVSGLFLVAFAVAYLVQLAVLAAGPEPYQGFVQAQASPGWIVFGVLMLAFSLVHSVTWIFLTSRIFVVRLSERPVPRSVLIVVGFAVWAAASVGVAFLLLRGA